MWLNSDTPITLTSLRGRVVLPHTVFEHHAVRSMDAWRAFVREYRTHGPAPPLSRRS